MPKKRKFDERTRLFMEFFETQGVKFVDENGERLLDDEEEK